MKKGSRDRSVEQLIKTNRDAILGLTAKHGALNPRLFGSVARNEDSPNSDKDLIMETRTLKEFDDILEPLGVLGILKLAPNWRFFRLKIYN